MVVIVLFGICIVGSVAAFLVALTQLRWIRKVKTYSRVEAQITKVVNASWSGDTADRDGGEYSVPVAEFKVESGQTMTFTLHGSEYRNYSMGQRIQMVYPPGQPELAIVFERKEIISTGIKYSVVGLILAGLAILLWYSTGLK
ncbi:DUF3592 domain-containing protein [Cytophagaceae bacterium YF14B1]|uniref:DUF3592 domain-containing protein n=1 Tax=Xanthocytophaga flava TaxID=3048013 RepID=A0AAE3U9R4_9BACT|nr:DUF3592 domain-containing protein [Xanthocytophaga flavus]MDJ1485384.1 DUF3592 domain-containing protein [Xanthocytophaga flavus]